jgi:hypothetical protein
MIIIMDQGDRHQQTTHGILAIVTAISFGLLLSLFTYMSASTKADQVAATKGATGMRLNITNVNKTGKLANQTIISTPSATSESKQAAQSIKGAITSTGQFLGNVTKKVVTSKSAQTILNESSELLGNATTTAKKYFGNK